MLARAIDAAATAQRWDIVAQLALELEARGLASAKNAVKLGRAKRREGLDGRPHRFDMTCG
jgi:hypothetical protein